VVERRHALEGFKGEWGFLTNRDCINAEGDCDHAVVLREGDTKLSYLVPAIASFEGRAKRAKGAI